MSGFSGGVLGNRLTEAPVAEPDEAFLTSALLSGMTLSMADGYPIGPGVPGPFARRLGEELEGGWWMVSGGR